MALELVETTTTTTRSIDIQERPSCKDNNDKNCTEQGNNRTDGDGGFYIIIINCYHYH